MDTINNPRLYECIDCTAANNIITAVRMAGVNLWACKGGVVAHNTIWQVCVNAGRRLRASRFLCRWLCR